MNKDKIHIRTDSHDSNVCRTETQMTGEGGGMMSAVALHSDEFDYPDLSVVHKRRSGVCRHHKDRIGQVTKFRGHGDACRNRPCNCPVSLLVICLRLGTARYDEESVPDRERSEEIVKIFRRPAYFPSPGYSSRLHLLPKTGVVQQIWQPIAGNKGAAGRPLPGVNTAPDVTVREGQTKNPVP